MNKGVSKLQILMFLNVMKITKKCLLIKVLKCEHIQALLQILLQKYY